MTADEMTVGFAGNDVGGFEWDEVYWCPNCGQDRLLGMELSGGRVLGTCEHCQTVGDFTPPDEDELLDWCPGCRAVRLFATDQNEEAGYPGLRLVRLAQARPV